MIKTDFVNEIRGIFEALSCRRAKANPIHAREREREGIRARAAMYRLLYRTT
jgi:hypothetical protein